MNKKQTLLDDSIIVDLYWSRDEKAIKATEAKYGSYLKKIAYNILHNKLDCEECINNAYFEIWKSIPPTKPLVFQAFITKIIRCVALNFYKEKNRKKHIPSELMISLNVHENSLHIDDTSIIDYPASEIGHMINDFVANLSERRRYIFIDRFYLAEPIKKIAKYLNLAESTVYKEIEIIRSDLRVYLEKEGVKI